MELGITATEINTRSPQVRPFAAKWTEEFNRGALLNQQFEVFGVVETEGFVARDRDDGTGHASACVGYERRRRDAPIRVRGMGRRRDAPVHASAAPVRCGQPTMGCLHRQI